jgi:hypothetical protein
MADGDGGSVCCIVGRELLAQVEHQAYRRLHLFFGGEPVSGELLLDPLRGVLNDGQLRHGQRQQDDSPRLPHLQGGDRVLDEDELLHRGHVRSVRRDDFLRGLKDAAQALLGGFCCLSNITSLLRRINFSPTG